MGADEPYMPGLIQNPNDWPHQGVLNELRW
jgi:hypothetical protein